MNSPAEANTTERPPFEFPDPAPLAITIYLIIHNSIYLLLLAYVVAVLIIRRKNRFLSPRTVPTLVPLQIFYFCFTLYSSLSIMIGKPPFCLGYSILYTILPGFSLHFNANIPTLVYHSDLNQVKVSRANGNIDAPVWRMIKFVSLKARLVYALITLALHATMVVCLAYFANLEGDCFRPATMGLGIHVLLYLLLLSYFLMRLSKVVDPFYMRFENNLGMVVNLPQIILLIIYPFAPSLFPPWFDYRWVVICTSPVMILVDGLFPVLLTYPKFVEALERMTAKNVVSDEEAKDVDTKGTIYALNQGIDVFQAVLSNAILLEAFTQFAIRDWCVENVLFYKAVERFKSEWEDSRASTERGLHIIREYVAAQAPMEVNLDDAVRKRVVQGAMEGNLPKTIFDQAQKHIYNLMERDSFNKWKKTVEFKRALEKVVDSRGSSHGSRVSKKNVMEVSS